MRRVSGDGSSQVQVKVCRAILRVDGRAKIGVRDTGVVRIVSRCAVRVKRSSLKVGSVFRPDFCGQASPLQKRCIIRYKRSGAERTSASACN